MTNKVLLCLILAFSYSIIFAQTPRLSRTAQISLLTCAPGQELYSTFGHSAVRVCDPPSSIDLVFNYGTFNMQQPNFYLLFVRGRLKYNLSLSYFDQFMYEYRNDKRMVVEQVLNLSAEQKQKMFDFLVWNYRPENRAYLYDFLFDNCATRFRDILPKVLNGKNYAFDRTIEQRKLTFRDLLDQYLENSPWEHIGINIILGAPTDRICTAEDCMFLPDYLHDAFAKTIVRDSLGKEIKLASPDRICYQPEAAPESANSIFTPSFIAYLLLIVFSVITFFEWSRKYYSRVLALLDSLFFFCLGLIGLLIIFMWFFTDHKVVVQNWNVIWACPFHLIFFFFYSRPKQTLIVRAFLLFAAALSFIALVCWKFLPQRFDLSIIPLLLIIMMRAFTMYKFRK